MVTEAVLNAFLPLLTGLLNLAGGGDGWTPLATLDDWAAKWGDTLASVWDWNSWVPISFAMTVLGVLLGLRMALFGYRMLRHLWDALPLT